ncbi:hypothetical protein [Mycoplasma yeatsii]|uniref:ABC-type glycerol-3-phosphate transport system permease component n=1 Tax=Mycoplasma yeatsii TaxID=51365 RepID=A0ABU0NDU3_9MOLU|nr:hypothetical protein [Mycoplasma yeatsii]MDQ0567618.1 ABC-type glycerol-3-phosphate transport system permease component [Mycoplasma yeatsii]
MKTFAIIFLIVVAGMFVHILYSVVHLFILSFRSSKQIKQAKTTVDETTRENRKQWKNFIRYWKFRKIIKQAVIEYKIESSFHKILSKDIENNKSNNNE